MKVSVIIPAYNAADTIAETLQSLFKQTFQNWEAIVVDDGSIDNTVAIVESLMEKDERIRLLSQQNTGPSGARNSGIALARYDWLLFLDADDWIFPQHLERLTSLLEADPSLDIVYCGWTYVLPDGEQVFQQCAGLAGDLFVPLTQYCLSIIHTFLVSLALVKAVGSFDPELRSCEDWALWQAIARTGARFGVVEEILAGYRTLPNSLSRNGHQLLNNGIQVLTRGHGFDPRVSQPHPVYPNGLPPEQLTKAKFDLLCACAGYLIGGGKDARFMLDMLKGEQCPTLNPYEVANCIFIHAMVSASQPRSEWDKVWSSCEGNLDDFLVALEAHSNTAKLAVPAKWIAQQLLMKYAKQPGFSARISAVWANLMLWKLSLPNYMYKVKHLFKRCLWSALLLVPPILRLAQNIKRLLGSNRKVELSNHPSNNPQEHFEQLFTENPDPWNYTNAYEQTKYEQTLAMIPNTPIESALELACAEGHFTVQFAPRVKKLLATDISESAINRTRKRCENLENVSFQCLDFMKEEIPGSFDLIVCSEVLYFVGKRKQLKSVVDKFVKALKPGGYLLMTHSNVLIDDPKSSGFDWDHRFGAKFIGKTFASSRELEFVEELGTPLYRIQLFRRHAQRHLFSHRSTPKSVKFLEVVEHHHLPPDIAADVVLTTTERLPILSYQRVAPADSQVGRLSAVTPEAFEAQLHYLREAGYRSISIEEWGYTVNSGNPVTGRAVAIIFDNSSQDFLHYAWPLLKRYGFSATVFIYTDEIDKLKAWDRVNEEEILLLEWKQIRQLQSEGVTFASHSASRRDLTALSLVEAWHEIKRSHKTLQNELAIPISTFAYPDGKFNPLLQYLVGVCGYDFALTRNSGLCSLNQSLLALPRIEVKSSDSLDAFTAKLTSIASNS